MQAFKASCLKICVLINSTEDQNRNWLLFKVYLATSCQLLKCQNSICYRLMESDRGLIEAFQN